MSEASLLVDKYLPEECEQESARLRLSPVVLLVSIYKAVIRLGSLQRPVKLNFVSITVPLLSLDFRLKEVSSPPK